MERTFSLYHPVGLLSRFPLVDDAEDLSVGEHGFCYVFPVKAFLPFESDPPENVITADAASAKLYRLTVISSFFKKTAE